MGEGLPFGRFARCVHRPLAKVPEAEELVLFRVFEEALRVSRAKGRLEQVNAVTAREDVAGAERREVVRAQVGRGLPPMRQYLDLRFVFRTRISRSRFQSPIRTINHVRESHGPRACT